MAPLCVLCKTQWLDIPSALLEQLDRDNDSEAAQRLRDLFCKFTLEYTRTEFQRSLNERAVNQMVYGYLTMGHAGLVLANSFESENQEGLRFSRLLMVFPTSESLESFLKARVCSRPCRILGRDVSRPRNWALCASLLVGRHVRNLKLAGKTLIVFYTAFVSISAVSRALELLKADLENLDGGKVVTVAVIVLLLRYHFGLEI